MLDKLVVLTAETRLVVASLTSMAHPHSSSCANERQHLKAKAPKLYHNGKGAQHHKRWLSSADLLNQHVLYLLVQRPSVVCILRMHTTTRNPYAIAKQKFVAWQQVGANVYNS